MPASPESAARPRRKIANAVHSPYDNKELTELRYEMKGFDVMFGESREGDMYTHNRDDIAAYTILYWSMV